MQCFCFCNVFVKRKQNYCQRWILRIRIVKNAALRILRNGGTTRNNRTICHGARAAATNDASECFRRRPDGESRRQGGGGASLASKCVADAIHRDSLRKQRDSSNMKRHQQTKLDTFIVKKHKDR